MTIAERVLRFIAESPNGRSSGEISKFIYELNYPGESGKTRRSYRWNHKTGAAKECQVPIHKGYWGTNLTGNPTTAGILESFCIKTPDRRYVVVEPIQAPFFRKHGGKMTKTYELNAARRTYDYKLREALAPKCPHCGVANTWNKDAFSTPDDKAHFNSWSSTYRTDCLDRVWTGRYNDESGLLTTLTKNQVSDFWNETRKIGLTWQQHDEVMRCYITNHLS